MDEDNSSNKMNLALISSQGGHAGQMKMIFERGIIEKQRVIFVTETPNKNLLDKKKSLNNRYPTYFFKKDNLRFNLLKYILTGIRLSRIFRKEKIDMIITNGAQLSIPAVVAAKIMRIKIIFIDTVIRVKTPNWSARACYPFSDIFLVQHENMKEKYGKKARYEGGIL